MSCSWDYNEIATLVLLMQVQMSMDNIQKSIKQIASNKEGVRQAEKAYSIMQKSFEIGSATFVESYRCRFGFDELSSLV